MVVRLLGVVLFLMVLGGCQLRPTKVRETPERKYQGADSLMAPIQVTSETVVVDARSPFEYSLAHIPHSINLQWTDFTQPEADSRGVLQVDLFQLARRLALNGIGPSTHVVVVGKGLGGEGEEGRIAWTLAYLGVANVQFTNIDALKFRMTNVLEENSVKSVPMWKPEPIEGLQVSRSELLFAINNLGVHQPISFKPGSAPVLYKIIDTRSTDNYLGRSGFGARRRVPNMDAINIPWKEFFDLGLHPRADLIERLNGVGVLREHRIIVLEEGGVSSADVTMALRALGFTNVGNYAGGLADLMASYSH